MSQPQKDQFEQQYNDALNGEPSNTPYKKDDANKIKDPENWTTGQEPMTDAQRSYLENLMDLHGEKFDNSLTKAQAAELIDQKKQNITVPQTDDQSSEFFNNLKNPDDWATGNEPATASQLSYIHTLSTEAGEDAKQDLNKADASKEIERLQQKTGRGM